MSTPPQYSVGYMGDSALLVTFEQRIDPLVNACVHAAAAVVLAARRAERAWARPVPGYASLLVRFDPLGMSPESALAALERLFGTVDWPVAAPEPASVIEVPVRYGGGQGPDLDTVAQRTGLTAAEVIDLHCSVVYRAYLLGFAPGFAYLGELPAALELPRRATPRPRVAAGSVAIAGRQTAVYPQATPGGWHLLGRTDLAIWDAGRPQPALIAPGAGVRFVALA